MSDLAFRRQSIGLMPDDDDAWAFYNGLNSGDVVYMDPKDRGGRSGRQNRWFWKLMQFLVDNQPRQAGDPYYIPSKELMKDRILIAIGEFDLTDMPGYGKFPVARHINFGAMSQKRFNELANRLVAFLNEHLSHVVGEDARRSLAEYLEQTA